MTTQALRPEAFAAPRPRTSAARVYTARILTGLSALFLIADGVFKLNPPPQVTEAMARLGFPAHLSPVIGTILLACVAVYIVPRTAVLGALLLTAYLGGAVATQLRAGSPLFAETLFPVYVALLVWAGLYLRDERVRALLPLRRHR